jgi:tetratricopeptide (TPR) repeat protein
LSTGTDLRRRLAELADPVLLPGTLAVAVFLVFAADEAGYSPTVWYPGALFLVALGAVALPMLAVPPSRAAVAAIVFLLAFTVWSFASIAWSDVRGDAWDGANRTLLYLVVYVLFALLPWTAATAALLLGLYSVGIAVLGTVVFFQAASAANPDAYFLLGRFAEPAGYQNANCALFLMAFFPAVFLASRREVPALVRALQLAAAGVLLELALLVQSRTSAVALPAALLVYLGLAPTRLRALAFVVPPVAAAALASEPVLDVFTAFREDAGVSDALAAARGALVVTAVALFAVGLVAAAVDRRIHLPARAVRVVGRVLAVAAIVAVLAGGVAAVAGAGDVAGRVSRAWDDFRTTKEGAPGDTYFSSGLGGNRYDVWRVALLEFRAAPLHGAGADNFAVAYLRERRSPEEPLYPHSLELRVLSQTGVVGALLFAGFLAAALAAVAPLRRRPAFARGVGAVAVAVFAYWLVHGSVDWFWEIAGLGAPAVAALGIAASLARERANGPVGLRRRGAVAAVLPAALAAATFVPPWLSAKEVQAAAASWRVEPQTAFDRLERARTLNPLSDNPDLVAGAIASRLGDRARMRASFSRALERNPHNWYAYLELAVVNALDGRPAEALRLLEQARRLSPTEPGIALVISQVRAGKPLSPAALDRLFLRRVDPEYRLPARD